MDKTLYNEKSIESLSPLEFTRLRPGVYAGDTTYATQLAKEILSNSIDEYRLGHGLKIEVNINGSIVCIRDYGQGFLINSFREDGKTILEAAFSVLNTSGKYREDGTYEGTSLGSFGIGCKLTNYLSNWLTVISFRDGQYEEVQFKEGIFNSRTIGTTDQPSGTKVIWQASSEFFTHPEIEIISFKKLLKTLTCLCPGLIISYNNENEHLTFTSPNGLNDLVDEEVKDKELIQNRFNILYQSGKYRINMVLTYTNSYLFTLTPYVNTGLTTTGPQITQIKSLLTREFNKFFREKNWLKEKDENLSGDDIQEGLYVIFDITAPGVAYDAQVKTRVTSIDLSRLLPALGERLRIWFTRNEKEIKLIADKAINAKKARLAAQKAKESFRENQQKKTKALKFDSKLADCNSRNRGECELFIVEGDSAAGNMKLARNNNFQAILPVRGKILNLYKAPTEKARKNVEIMSFLAAIGLEEDKQRSLQEKIFKATFNPKALRYGKIIIMSDADVDGAHIKNLFYTAVWSICPELITEGYIYAGFPPLYKITTSQGYTYLKDDAALIEWQKTTNKKYEVNRLKGLGEMDPEEVEMTLLDPTQRIIKQITVSDIKLANKLFEDLMGTAITPRKEYIQKHSNEATYV